MINTKGISLGYVIGGIKQKPIHEEKLFALFESAGRIVGVFRDGFYIILDKKNNTGAIFGNFSPQWDNSYLNAFIFTPLVELIIRASGFFSVHAGAVEDKTGNCILIFGDSGTGKTTATLRKALSGSRLMGDDTIMLDDQLNAFSFLKPLHLYQDSLKLLGLSTELGPVEKGKGEFTISELPSSIEPYNGRAKIEKLYFLGLAGGNRTMEPAEVFRKLLSYSMIPIGKEGVQAQMGLLKKISSIPAVEISREEFGEIDGFQ